MAFAAGRRIAIRGTVQGVGFRPWIYRLARGQGLTGGVRNDARGVTVEAFGSEPALRAFLEGLKQPPPAAVIREVLLEPLAAPRAPAEFSIEPSDTGGHPEPALPPDLGLCPACAREVRDPRDRRFGYAFTTCTDCGPRYTITRAVPYDRERTTMAPFTMCARCAAEFASASDRRFHAQPIACAQCGPRLWLRDAAGEARRGDPLRAAAAALLAGLVVAVKGLGGYHLACDATSAAAVMRLRARKRREAKPLAVMVAGLAEAEELAELGAPERALLAGPERPIVIVRRKPDASLAEVVSPGSPFLGLVLAYTPLHLLLLEAAGRPLVMTSGNRAEEPMACTDSAAREVLAEVADLWLGHDREIAARCDDSVARVVAGAPLVLRRARGYAPRGLPLAREVPRPVLACGGHLKNAFCLASGRTAWLGPHVGDLDTPEAREAFAEGVERLTRFLGLQPRVIAHDLHPDYFTTRWAAARPEPRVAVQHHFAHVASVMAENGVEGPVLGVAYDGTGLGTDGSSWGGELLLCDRRSFTRLATLRPLPLLGGEAAIHEVWRLALAAVVDAFGDDACFARLPLGALVPERARRAVAQLLARAAHAPLAHGAGRWFDAAGALALGLPAARFEGEVALAAEGAAAASLEPYGFALDTGRTPWQIDLRPALQALVEDRLRGRDAAEVLGRFHQALAAATAAAVWGARAACGTLPVALGGGCFQNDLFTHALLSRLQGLDVLRPREVPPGDGGLALGQAWVAASAEEG